MNENESHVPTYLPASDAGQVNIQQAARAVALVLSSHWVTVDKVVNAVPMPTDRSRIESLSTAFVLLDRD